MGIWAEAILKLSRTDDAQKNNLTTRWQLDSVETGGEIHSAINDLLLALSYFHIQEILIYSMRSVCTSSLYRCYD